MLSLSFPNSELVPVICRGSGTALNLRGCAWGRTSGAGAGGYGIRGPVDSEGPNFNLKFKLNGTLIGRVSPRRPPRLAVYAMGVGRVSSRRKHLNANQRVYTYAKLLRADVVDGVLRPSVAGRILCELRQKGVADVSGAVDLETSTLRRLATDAAAARYSVEAFGTPSNPGYRGSGAQLNVNLQCSDGEFWRVLRPLAPVVTAYTGATLEAIWLIQVSTVTIPPGVTPMIRHRDHPSSHEFFTIAVSPTRTVLKTEFVIASHKTRAYVRRARGARAVSAPAGKTTTMGTGVYACMFDGHTEHCAPGATLRARVGRIFFTFAVKKTPLALSEAVESVYGARVRARFDRKSMTVDKKRELIAHARSAGMTRARIEAESEAGE